MRKDVVSTWEISGEPPMVLPISETRVRVSRVWRRGWHEWGVRERLSYLWLDTNQTLKVMQAKMMVTWVARDLNVANDVEWRWFFKLRRFKLWNELSSKISAHNKGPFHSCISPKPLSPPPHHGDTPHASMAANRKLQIPLTFLRRRFISSTRVPSPAYYSASNRLLHRDSKSFSPFPESYCTHFLTYRSNKDNNYCSVLFSNQFSTGSRVNLRCWSCDREAETVPFLFCEACRSVQPVDHSVDYFEIFGLWVFLLILYLFYILLHLLGSRFLLEWWCCELKKQMNIFKGIAWKSCIMMLMVCLKWCCMYRCFCTEYWALILKATLYWQSLF